jgi:hypothetical protein
MEDLLKSVGEFGRFQYRITLIVGLISALVAACIYATVFIAAEPKLMCTRSDRSQKNGSSFSVEINKKKTCQIINGLKSPSSSRSSSTQAQNYTCSFDTQYYQTTIVTEYSLVCERQYLTGLTQTVFFLGGIFGFCGGMLGDKYGRRTSTLLFLFLLTSCLIVTQVLLDISSISVDFRYAIYTISQFLIGKIYFSFLAILNSRTS